MIKSGDFKTTSKGVFNTAVEVKPEKKGKTNTPPAPPKDTETPTYERALELLGYESLNVVQTDEKDDDFDKLVTEISFDLFLFFWIEKKLVSSSHICIIEYIEPY